MTTQDKWSADRIVSAVYVTQTKRGPRFSYWARGRLWPLCREAAEASFANGATIYSKKPGVSVWQESPEVFIG